MASTTGSLRRPHASSRARPRKAGHDAARPEPGFRGVLPRRWVESVLPAELPLIAREVIKRIQEQIPEFRHPLDGPQGRSLRDGAERAVLCFRTQYLRSGKLAAEGEEFFRQLGRREALEGRSPDVVQSAFRIGALAAWNRIQLAAERDPLPAEVVGSLAASIFSFADLLARLSSEGFAAAHGEDMLVQSRLRARLARMICAQPDVPADALRELAARLEWPIPERVAVLDLRFDDSEQDPYPALVAGFGIDALAEIEPGSRLVVLPDPVDASAVAAVAAAVPGSRISVGCTLPFAEAPQSLRWARLASRLRGDGLLPDLPVTACEEHLPLLLLQAEPGIADTLVSRRLGPLLDLPEGRRLKFAQLLSSWLEHGGSQAELAAALGTHRQTLHYRIGRLQAMFGEQLRDADARVEIVLALRAVLPVWDRAGTT